MGRKSNDLTGQRFGRLVAIGKVGCKNKSMVWHCKCDCGGESFTEASKLRNGRAKSCGCLREEINRSPLKKKRRAKVPRDKRLYYIWQGMKDRCYNPQADNYYLYGEKGIKICEEWLKDFLNFQSWSFANGYKNTLSIDRIHNNLGYSPSNCRWATPKEQSNNRTTNKNFTINNETKTLKEWCEQFNKRYPTVWARVNRGWDIYKALEISPQEAIDVLKNKFKCKVHFVGEDEHIESEEE